MFSGQALPLPTSRCFHSKNKDLRNNMYNATTKLRLSKLDQESQALKAEKWKIQYPDEEAEDEEIKVREVFAIVRLQLRNLFKVKERDTRMISLTAV